MTDISHLGSKQVEKPYSGDIAIVRYYKDEEDYSNVKANETGYDENIGDGIVRGDTDFIKVVGQKQFQEMFTLMTKRT